VRIPPAVDRVLRWFVVTPAMHCVHHSVAMDESNSNFGFALPWWDRLLGTYRDAPAEGVVSMRFGVDACSTSESCLQPHMPETTRPPEVSL
jgi:sterol desaturase/sphingolipid hydroxylase (fatty acid hydroxylase superfamily)